MKKIYHLGIILTAVLAFSCGGGGGDDPAPLPPAAAQLVFPENNSECLTGEDIASNPSRSNVTLSWTTAERATSYEMQIRNLNTNVRQNFTTPNNAITVDLEKGVPYEWQVFTISSSLPGEKVGSELFRFYNAGDGVENYAPFPATLQSPVSGQSLIITSNNLDLRWEGSDVDGDIVNYEVFFDIVNPPATFIAETGTIQRLNVSGVQSGNTYYWQVRTTDGEGNTSISEVSEFRIQ